MEVPVSDGTLSPDPSLAAVSSGVDSLYVAVHGEMRTGTEAVFASMREMADDDAVAFDMGPEVGSFLLRLHGWRGYPIWLSSPRYELMLGAPKPFPVAYAQLHSAFIHTLGAEEAAAAVEQALRDFVRIGRITVSRIDLYTDTQGWTPPHDADRFVCRARKGTTYYDEPGEQFSSGRPLTGFKFGKGAVVARIYDKTLELRSRGETWPEVLWRGADASLPVWRVEFQFRREALGDCGLKTVADALGARDDLWEYGTRWLSLRTPTGSERRSNWPVAPEWEALRAVCMGMPRSALVRERVRTADERRLVRGFAGYASSLAAAWSDDDLDEVLRRAAPQVRRYLNERGTCFTDVARAKRRRRIGL